MGVFITGNEKPIGLVALALIFMSTLSTSNAFLTNPKVTVNITNALDQGKTLSFHCQSKDDDLGVRDLLTGKSWSFQFRPHYLFAPTLFYCRMVWPDMGPTAFYVDIYDNSRDKFKKLCWNIRNTGPCLHDCKGKPGFFTCFQWKKPPAHQIAE